MQGFPVLEDHDFPPALQALLSEVKTDFGFVPNLERILASSPVALKGYVALWDLMAEASLGALEVQVACQEINRLHQCHYCLAHHDVLLKQAGADAALRDAMITGMAVADQRLQALRAFVVTLVVERGHVNDTALSAFVDAGFRHAHVLELVTILACKVMSNYTNHLAHTPLETFIRPVT